MNIKNILVVGTGNMGRQIALQHAIHGFNVTIYGRREQGLAACKAQQASFRESILTTCPGFSKQDFDAALARTTYTTDLEAAGSNIDLVSESVTEELELKQQIFSDLERICPEHTIFTTNTSTLMPSHIAIVLKRPERFLALHYSSPVWERPMAEIMKLPNTSDESFNTVIAFAKASGLMAIPLDKEHPGYILNSFLAPIAFTALAMLANGIATHQDIDRTWLLNFPGMGIGPCGILDQMGFNSLLAVSKIKAAEDPDNPAFQSVINYIQQNFIDKGHLGFISGQGLYSYPDPEYLEADFITT